MPALASLDQIDFAATELNVPVVVEAQTYSPVISFEDVVINKDFTAGKGAQLNFTGKSRLSNGATLTLGGW